MSLIDLSRWQFAITVMFHMTFPAITVGLSILLCVLYGMHWKTGNPVYLQMFRFWRRIFAVGFAIGAVAGVVILLTSVQLHVRPDTRPDSLLIDEPTSGLDARTAAQVLAVIRQRLPRTVLVLAMHEPCADLLASGTRTVSLE
jgi:hypothetical protein